MNFCFLLSGFQCLVLRGFQLLHFPTFTDSGFFDEEFRNAHPDVVSPKSDDPEKEKEIGDSVALKPVLTDFLIHTSLSAILLFSVIPRLILMILTPC